jgi:endonuclease/exonuclease/phosphatase family metal-dependent hydrolase
MLSRLRSLSPLRLPALIVLEAALIGLFFIQALRFLIGAVYARIASASLYPALDPNLIDPNLPGLVEPAVVSAELSLLVFMIALPLLTLIAGRLRWLLLVAVVITAGGRYLMAAEAATMPVNGAAITIGGGLLYLSLLIRHRAQALPYMFILALAADQLYRAFGNTLDPSWASGYTGIQVFLSVAVVILALWVFIGLERQRSRDQDSNEASPNNGLMTFWGGIGLGALLFLQLSLLALPNAAAGRARTDYTLLVPLLMAATTLPLLPWVRAQARAFVGLFDSSVRGWLWMLLIMLLLVFGLRFQGIFAGAALVIAQFCASMVWWWLTRPRARRERSFTGLWIVLGMVGFGLLVVLDIFTYEYAFVRELSPELGTLNEIVPLLLRGLRGMGLGVLLLAILLACMPIVQTRRRIAWPGGGAGQTLAALVMVVGLTAGSAYASRPPVIRGVSEPEAVRIGTYNIHAGYNEFFHYDLEALARVIQQSGANIVLLQEIEAGRLTSFGVDQPLWLARRLGMDRRFFGANERLQGLAVLSNIEIVFHDGALLDSLTTQTGLQRVQVRPDAGVITIYNTWLDPLLATGEELSTQELESGQQAQLSQIFSLITAQHPPDGQLGRTVIGGTFHNVPDSDLIQRMRDSGFVDHFAGMPLELSATFWRTGQRARLDYLWTTRLQVIGHGVSDARASDHRLAVIEVQLR